MQVIPVLDLLGGSVVRGVAGQRSEYRPIRSQLCHDAQPTTVSRALREHFGFQTAYVADLDAIAGAEPAWNVYRDCLAEGWQLWVDAGITTLHRAEQLAKFTHHGRSLAGVIVGLESLAAPEMLDELLAIIGPARLWFSLDLKQGRPLTQIAAWQHREPLDIAREVQQRGIERWIVLDLAGVGVGGGINTLDLCRELRGLAPTAQIVSGGGVRNRTDLDAAAQSGCDGVLVASALHDGRLTRGDLQRLDERLR